MSTDYDPSELEIRSGAAEPTPEPEPKPEEEVASEKPAAAQVPESKADSATQPPAENASEEATKRRISPRQLRHRKRNRNRQPRSFRPKRYLPKPARRFVKRNAQRCTFISTK